MSAHEQTTYPNTCGHGDGSTQECRLCIAIDLDQLAESNKFTQHHEWWERSHQNEIEKNDE